VFESRTQSPIHPTAHTDACKKILYCTYNCLPYDEHKRFETCRRHQKLEIKY
jgi:hypothetical protein